MMKFIANENIPAAAVKALRALGYEVSWITEEAPGSSDDDILTWARNEKRIILTFDKDFGELAFHSKLPLNCGIILFRIPFHSPDFVSQFIARVIQSRNDWEGNFSVVEEKRIRIRSL